MNYECAKCLQELGVLLRFPSDFALASHFYLHKTCENLALADQRNVKNQITADIKCYAVAISAQEKSLALHRHNLLPEFQQSAENVASDSAELLDKKRIAEEERLMHVYANAPVFPDFSSTQEKKLEKSENCKPETMSASASTSNKRPIDQAFGDESTYHKISSTNSKKNVTFHRDTFTVDASLAIKQVVTPPKTILDQKKNSISADQCDAASEKNAPLDLLSSVAVAEALQCEKESTDEEYEYLKQSKGREIAYVTRAREEIARESDELQRLKQLFSDAQSRIESAKKKAETYKTQAEEDSKQAELAQKKADASFEQAHAAAILVEAEEDVVRKISDSIFFETQRSLKSKEATKKKIQELGYDL